MSTHAFVNEAFEQWWSRDGRFIDPDTDDVPWFDKRKELCGLAFQAATAQSGNYVTDDAVEPHEVTFANGRRVRLNPDGRFLEIDKTESVTPAAVPAFQLNALHESRSPDGDGLINAGSTERTSASGVSNPSEHKYAGAGSEPADSLSTEAAAAAPPPLGLAGPIDDYSHWREMAADTVNLFWFTNREARVLLAEIDRLRSLHAATEGKLQHRLRLSERAYERLQLCSDHRDKANGRCIVCVAEERTRRESVAEGALRALVDSLVRLMSRWNHEALDEAQGLGERNRVRSHVRELTALLPARPASVKET